MKITKLEPKTYMGKPNGFKVTLADGTYGNLKEKDSDSDFKEGEEVDVVIEDYINKKGEHSNLLILKKSKGTPPAQSSLPKDITFENNINPYQPKSIEEHKVNASVEAMRFVYEAFSNQRIDAPQIAEFQRRAVEILWNEIDEIFNKK